MAKLSREDLINSIVDYIGEDKSDNAITLIENVTDSIEDSVDVSSYEARITELEKKVEETENTWREKYISRFKDYTPTPTKDVKTEVDSGANSEDGDIEPPSFEDIAKEI